ncbi:MAG: NUDIX hydrolase [Candidatus Marsarchaeota archaeon]|nr:NUDIX hydrolase [Candidatus Marsarchaeota archaeon]
MVVLERIVYRRGPYSIREKTVKIRGRDTFMFRVLKPDAAVILPLIDENTILMEFQYRHPLNKSIYELPAGAIEKGESARSAAVRELEEETGYRAKVMKKMFKTLESPGITSTVFTYYLATGLYRGNKNLDEGEIIRIKKIKFPEAIKMIKNGEIIDAKTVLGIMHYLCRSNKDITGGYKRI